MPNRYEKKTISDEEKRRKREFLSASLDDKILKSSLLIVEWYHQFEGKVYVSFSGGKDSTVLLHLVRSKFPDVKAVFFNTGLEYPDVVKFVRTFDNVEEIRPKLTFREVIEKYGWPVASKDQSSYVHEYVRSKSELRKKQILGEIEGYKNFSLRKRWRFLLDAPFPVSNYCCKALKKEPSHELYRKTGLTPFIADMAEESRRRMNTYFSTECNSFTKDYPASHPMQFWTNKDIWEYVDRYKLGLCPLYSQGLERTGCAFCGYGAHRNFDRFRVLYRLYPKLYFYLMDKLGMRDVLKYIKAHLKTNDIRFPDEEPELITTK